MQDLAKTSLHAKNGAFLAKNDSVVDLEQAAIAASQKRLLPLVPKFCLSQSLRLVLTRTNGEGL